MWRQCEIMLCAEEESRVTSGWWAIDHCVHMYLQFDLGISWEVAIWLCNKCCG